MVDFNCKIVLLFIIYVSYSISFASIDAEMEGMEVDSQDNGTFLVGSPTYYFDRILGAGGVHSESELWTPQKIRYRFLLNRMSMLPSWTPLEPAIWIKTGNELGDMIYQDFITTKNKPDNRTPILEGGFRTPSYRGFWITGRAFQDDHFSSTNVSYRKKWVNDEFALFGENYPMFSSIYAGFGYDSNLVKTSFLAGEEYIWLFTESSRWIPVHYRPRIEGRLDLKAFSFTLSYENGEYQNFSKKEKGNRKEWSGSIYYKCDELCSKQVFQISSGIAYRFVNDSGMVYTELKKDRVLLPFVELGIQPLKHISAKAMFAINDRDFLLEDSVEVYPNVPSNMGVILGVKNISGTRLNPLADNREFFENDTISLNASGQMNLIQGYLNFVDTLGYFQMGGRGTYWAEYGAETFSAKKYIKEGKLNYRDGDVERINSWIKGITGEIWIGTWYKEMFNFKALGGFEHISGDIYKAEVTPAEFFVSFSADWLFRKSFRISHSLRYRSDAQWNLRYKDSYIIKGDWFWDATFEQRIPLYELYLIGTILHVLGDEVIETPNGSENRLRFICKIKKNF